MSMNGLLRCQAKLTQPKAGVAACLAMIPSAYNGTSCPATAASNGGSSERSSEGLDSRWALPGAGSFNRPTVREVVSNRTEQKTNFRNGEGRSAIQGNVRCCQQTAERPLLSTISQQKVCQERLFDFRCCAILDDSKNEEVHHAADIYCN